MKTTLLIMAVGIASRFGGIEGALDDKKNFQQMQKTGVCQQDLFAEL